MALTGYNGILGYRTDESYETRPADLDENKVQWLDAHPDFSLEKERAAAKKVADAMKAEGWEFASHTWGHQNVGQVTLEKLQADTERFKKNVDPLIGGTDVIIFAFGTDITNDQEYSGDKFEYLKGRDIIITATWIPASIMYRSGSVLPSGKTESGWIPYVL